MSFSKEETLVRYVYGLAYPNLRKGGKHRDRVSFQLSVKTNYAYENKKTIPLDEFRKQLYNDRATFLDTDDLKATQFYGKPIRDNHNSQSRVGSIIEAFQSSKNEDHVLVLAKIEDPETIKRVDSGEYGGFSFGYVLDLGKNDDDELWSVTGKEIAEISLCKKGFFEPCKVYVRASEDGGEVSRDGYGD